MPKWDQIPDLGNLPEGVYLFRVEGLEPTTTKEKGKLMYKIELRAEEPKEFTEVPAFDQFVIGSDDDPEASLDDTWIKSFGARRMKALAKAAQVPLDDNMDVFCASLAGSKIIGDMKVTEDKDPNSAYFGRENRQVTYYQVGQKQVSVAAKATGGALPGAGSRPTPRGKAPQAAAAQAPSAPAAPNVKPASPRAPAPKAPASPRAPTPKPRVPATAAQAEWYECEECKVACLANGGDPALAFADGGALVPKNEFRDHIINAHADA